MASVVALHVADAPSVWEGLGFAVDDGVCRIGSVSVELVGGDGEGIVSWSLAGALVAGGDLDGLGTSVGTEAARVGSPPHPNGVVAIDHIVVSTPQLERTVAAFDQAGLLLRRRRDAGATYGTALHQAFFRVGDVIVEVVGPAEPGSDSGPARFFGLALTVSDMDETASYLGERLRPAKEAVQERRVIATLARDAGSSVALAFMSPEPGSAEPGRATGSAEPGGATGSAEHGGAGPRG